LNVLINEITNAHASTAMNTTYNSLDARFEAIEAGKANTSDIPTVPTNVSAFTNDAGYLTAH